MDRVFVSSEPECRLDRLLADQFACGRREARTLIETGAVTVDGRQAAAGTVVRAGSRVAVHTRDVDPVAPTHPSLSILWEDDDTLAIDKPVGVHSHRGAEANSIADRLVAERPDAAHAGEDANDCGIAHRLDRDTSGVLLAAKTPERYRELRAAFAGGRTRKLYLALGSGRLDSTLDIRIELARRRRSVVPARHHSENSYPARTVLVPLETAGDWTLVLAEMHTGVTHQIRAHMSLAGAPILGDEKYGGPRFRERDRYGHLLHALSLGMEGVRRADGRPMKAVASPPRAFLETLAALRRHGLAGVCEQGR